MKTGLDKETLLAALKQSVRQFAGILPILLGVALLIGMFNALVPRAVLVSVVPGNPAQATLWGATLGSLLAGNPINSYILGGELLNRGVSLFAVTAIVVTWTTVGLVQLPVEVAALGKKFSFLRNSLSFVISIPVAILTVIVFTAISG